MAIKNLLSRFRSISRPSLSAGSTGTFSSLAKKQASAEDAIIDNQYADGDLSAEAYLKHLNIRLERSWITPLQTVNISEKIKDAKTALVDAQVNRDYQTGTLTTKQVYDYEKAKLDNMTDSTSAAYIKQQQKVQGLLDKSEKESRSSYRITENKRISTLPEDSSQRLWAKAQEYEKLAAQARLDGDAQQADVLETQKNNYVSAAKRGDVNDLITNARLSVSQTPDAGLGVPSAEKGAALYAQLMGGGGTVSGGATTGGGGSQPAPSVVSTRITSPAIRNAMECLDYSKNIIDRLYQSKSDKGALVTAYQNAVNSAVGDQKTQLTIALNNLVDDVKGIDNQIAIQTQNVQEVIGRIQEAQAKAAASAYRQEVRRNEMEAKKIEDSLEEAFSIGIKDPKTGNRVRISKEEYIAQGLALAGQKVQFYNDVSGGFSQYGNEVDADKYMTKLEEMQTIHESLIQVASNPDDYESVAVDPSGNVNNLFGKKVRPGQITLLNVRQLKDSGQWESNYVKSGDAWYKIHYPGEVSDVTGLPQTPAFNKELGRLEDKAFIYKVGGEGKTIQEAVRLVEFRDESNKPIKKVVTQSDVDTLSKEGKVVQDLKKGYFVQKTNEPSLVQAVGSTVKKVGRGMVNELMKQQQMKQAFGQKIINYFSGGAQKLVQTVSPFVQKAIESGRGILDKARGFFDSAVSKTKSFLPGMKLPSIIPSVSAYEMAPKEYDDLINEIFGDQAESFKRILGGENVRRETDIVTENRINPKTGKYDQNSPVMMKPNPLTGEMIPSKDYGLARNNNITYYDFMKRFPDRMKEIGMTGDIESDLRDPRKSLALAKLTADKQGGAAFYAAPDDLRNRQPLPSQSISIPTPTPTVKTTITPTTISQNELDRFYKQGQYAPPPPPSIPQRFNNFAQQAIKKISPAIQNTVSAVKPVVQNISSNLFNVAKNVGSNISQAVRRVATPVVQRVQQNVSSFLNKLNPFKKK